MSFCFDYSFQTTHRNEEQIEAEAAQKLRTMILGKIY